MSIFDGFGNYDWNLDPRENVVAHHLGDALRAGNVPDVHDTLAQEIFNPNLREMIRFGSDEIRPKHFPTDVHGPDGFGVSELRINPDNTVDIVNRYDRSSHEMLDLGAPGRAPHMV
jgi:hypothetical protein